MWAWELCGSRHFEPMSYSVWPQLPHRGELIIVSLGISTSMVTPLLAIRFAATTVFPNPVGATSMPSSRCTSELIASSYPSRRVPTKLE